MKNVFLKECNVLKTNQYEALQVWKLLNISKELYLFSEKDNEKDCVSLYYKVTQEDKDNDKDINPEHKDKYYAKLLNNFFKIGNLSEEDATPEDKFLKARQNPEDSKDKNDLFECRISKFDKEADEDKRISVAIFIKGTEDSTSNKSPQKKATKNSPTK